MLCYVLTSELKGRVETGNAVCQVPTAGSGQRLPVVWTVGFFSHPREKVGLWE